MDVAQDELREETGLIAKSMKKIGHLYGAHGFSTQGFYVFYTSDFEHGEQSLEASEAGMEVCSVTIKEFESMVGKGQIKDSSSVSAYGLLRLKGIQKYRNRGQL